METASVSGLFKWLLIICLVYYGLRFLMRLLAPVIVQEVVKKAEKNFNRQNGYNDTQHTQSRQNTYSKPVSDKPKEKKKVGEYIDFEEIE